MKKIFITGATGFIGGRLAEMACARGLSVVALVRAWSHAALLSRLPVQMVAGDILSPEVLHQAMQGCDVVFHCAIDNTVAGDAHRLSSVQGTVNVMQAALDTGVKRLVHLSSAAVNGYHPGPDAATEDAPYRYTGDDYCDGKIDGEKAALRFWQEHRLPVTVLRPTIVYGPYGFQTVGTATILRSGRMILVGGARGICNGLYVDNLVEAMLLAAEHPAALGQAFTISDASTVSWKEFIEAHARALGGSYLPLPELTLQEMEALWAQAGGNSHVSSLKQTINLVRDPQFRESLASVPLIRRTVRLSKSVGRLILPGSVRRWMGQKTSVKNPAGLAGANIQPEAHPILMRSEMGMFNTFDQVTFSIDKARRLLGYEPAIDSAEGLRRTAAWIQWARL